MLYAQFRSQYCACLLPSTNKGDRTAVATAMTKFESLFLRFGQRFINTENLYLRLHWFQYSLPRCASINVLIVN